MYSWNTIRIACSVLLLLPIVHLAWLMSRDTMETLNTSPNAWAREVASFAAADAGMQLPASPMVVVGGQRVKLWPDLEDQPSQLLEDGGHRHRRDERDGSRLQHRDVARRDDLVGTTLAWA